MQSCIDFLNPKEHFLHLQCHSEHKQQSPTDSTSLKIDVITGQRMRASYGREVECGAVFSHILINMTSYLVRHLS